MKHLLPCPGCTRHVRAADATCPFCGEVLPLSLRQSAPRLPGRRLGRAATFAFGAALAATGCGESTPEADASPMDAGEDAFVASFDAAYGAPPFDAGPPPIDSGADAGGDAGDSTDAGTDAGETVADAGPTPDAGMDGGGVFPPYGTPPKNLV